MDRSGRSTSSTRYATGSPAWTRPPTPEWCRPSTCSPRPGLAWAGLGRPLVDTIHGSSIANLKELRPGTVRVLFAFDPWRSSILLVAGDKAGRWNEWYREAIPGPSNATRPT